MRLLVCAVAVAVFFAVPTRAECGRDYTIAVFDWRKTDGEARIAHGFEMDQEIWNKVFARADCDVNWRILGAKRLLNAVKGGSVDGAVPASKTTEREAYSYFTDAYRNEELVGFVRREQFDKIHIQSIADIRRDQLRLALAYGSWYGPEIEGLLKSDPVFKDKVSFFDDSIVMMKWLQTGHVDMLLAWRRIAERLLDRGGFLGTQIMTYPAVLYDEPSYLMLSKASVSDEDVALLNSVLADFLRSEEYAKILERY